MIGLKAYSVYPGNDPRDMGCQLVFAPNRNKARMEAFPVLSSFWEIDYIDITAVRAPAWDIYVRIDTDKAYHLDENRELSEGAPEFYTEMW